VSADFFPLLRPRISSGVRCEDFAGAGAPDGKGVVLSKGQSYLKDVIVL